MFPTVELQIISPRFVTHLSSVSSLPLENAKDGNNVSLSGLTIELMRLLSGGGPQQVREVQHAHHPQDDVTKMSLAL